MTQAANVTWSHRSRGIPLIVSLCAVVAGTVMAAEGDGAAIEGRWETTRKDLVLDIGRCAQGYCGQLVTPDDRCDRTILTVAVETTPLQPLELAFAGNFAPPKGIRPHYKVRVSVTTAPGSAAGSAPAHMVIIGDEVDPDPMRRTFPYRAVLARVGEAICRPATTS